MDTLHLNIIEPAGEVITLDVFAQEPVFDLRNVLNDHPSTCYQTNYYFQKKDGTRIKEYQEIKEALGSERDIYIKNDLYNQQALKIHTKRLREILLRTVTSQSNQQIEVNDNEKYLDAMANRKGKKIECLLTFNYACFHPPPAHRKILGDIGYLFIRTLENQTYYVTAKTSGFYVNKSQTEESKEVLTRHFDPEPRDKESYFSKTLVELLKKISPKFEQLFKELCSTREDVLEGYCIRPSWQIKQPETNYEIMIEEEYGTDLFGYDITAMRDWNEEYQMAKALPVTILMQKLQRDRTIHKVYTEFTEAAIKGAQAAVEGSLPALNPSEDYYQQVYVFNNIFFSFVKDTPLSYRQEIGQDACATRTSNGHDFRSLKILQNLQIQGLSTILTAILDYRGYRVVAQGLVPGLLSNEPDKATQYGSMDDGKQISWTPEFHSLMEEVCKQLYLKPSKFTDKDGKLFEIFGGIDVKGIQGTDKRRYILEFLRHAPRDANYQGPDFELCLLRPELVIEYNRHLSHTQELAQKIEERQQEGELKEEQKEQIPKVSYEEDLQSKSEQKAQENQNEQVTPNQSEASIKSVITKNFDVTAFSSLWTSILTEEEAQEAKQDILTLSQFLVESQLKKVLKELELDLGFYDSVSLGELMHENGVNIRYLGALLELQMKSNEKNVHIINLLQRTALIRAAKYVFNQYIRETSDIFLTQVISNLFNAVLCPNPEKKSKKKKKKDKKTYGEVMPESIKINQEELWNKICQICLFRYKITLGEIQNCECLKTQELKYVFMREMCCTIGAQIKCTSQPFPLKAENILQLVPIVKLVIPKSQEAANSLAAALTNPLNPDLLSQAIQTNTQTTGPLNQGIAFCYSQLAKIHFQLGDVSQALLFQTRNILVLEKLLGNDHPCLIKEYQQFAYFFHAINDFTRSYECMNRALWLHKCSIGEITPVYLSLLTNMSVIARDCEKFEESLQYITLAMEIGQDQDLDLKKIYVKTLCLSGQREKAIEEQNNVIQQLKSQYGNEDQRVVQAQLFLEVLLNPELQKNNLEESKQNNKGRTIGQNKPFGNIGRQKNKQEYKVNEKQLLLKQKLHAKISHAKMNIPGIYKANPHLDPEFRQYQHQLSTMQSKTK